MESANLSIEQMKAAIPKLERRIQDLRTFDVDQISSGSDPKLVALETAIATTLDSVYGSNTIERARYGSAQRLDDTTYVMAFGGGGGTSAQEIRDGVRRGMLQATALLEQAVVSLKEELGDLGHSNSGRALQAYEGLELHPEIARAAGQLYRGGHYANAIEDAVKALNALVRLRSGSDLDGTSLMENVFSANRPTLKFNALADESDRNEQKGFMMLFSGAVAGLRNPRAHKLIKDDAERALEFIAFISLLAKLLDRTTK